MNIMVLGLLLASLPTVAPSSSPRILEDSPSRWRGVWTLGEWSCDSSRPARRIVAPSYPVEPAAGGLEAPVLQALVALPPEGSWSVEVRRDAVLDVPGSRWARVLSWPGDRREGIEVPPATPPAWVEETRGGVRMLRLSIPWMELSAGQARLSRVLHVDVRMSGAGRAALPPEVGNIVVNPAGGSRFGTRTSGIVAGRAARATAAALVPSGAQDVVFTLTEPAPGDMSRSQVASISGEQLRTVLGTLSGIDFDRVAVGAGALGAIALRNDSAVPQPGLPVIPIRRVDKNRNGRFDPEDRIEFFASTPSHWARDRNDSILGQGIFSMRAHPWDLSRRYLVRLDADNGSPELPVGKAPADPRRSPAVLRPVWAGRHAQLRVPGLRGEFETPDFQSGTGWFWFLAEKKVYDSARMHHPATFALPGYTSGSGVAVVRYGGSNNMAPDSYDSFRTVSGISTYIQGVSRAAAWRVTGLKERGNGWRWRSSQDAQDFESYTVHYPHAPSRAALVPFPAPEVGAFSLPVMGGTSSDSVIAVEHGVGVRVLPLADGLLVDSARVDGTWYVPAASAPAPSGTLARWRAATGSNVLTPSQMAGSVSAAMVIVAPDSFLDLASQHAAFRSDARRIRPLETKVVRTEDLWMLWGRGSRDPLAVRDMLRFARDHWGTTHVLLMGGGHYDSRGLTGVAPGPIPVWEDHSYLDNRFTTNDRSASTDAVLAYLDPGAGMASVAVGRFPARSRREVSAMLAKIRLWEDPAAASPGPWRNTFLLAADDMVSRELGGVPDKSYQGSNGHTEMTEDVAKALAATRPWAQFRKVYQVEYPMNAVLEKPDAQRALLDQLNRGVAAMQYLGHGGYDILADERLLDTRSALAGLHNARSPFLFLVGSCTVGRHDQAIERGMAELLCVTPDKGSVAALAATRPSYGGTNRDFLKVFWAKVLSTRLDGRPRTLGESIQEVRNMQSGSLSFYVDNQYYDLLGDPAMVPFPAGSPIGIDAGLDTLAALDVRSLKGRAESDVQLSLISPSIPRTETFVYKDQTYKQSYVLPGRTLVSLRTKAVDGRFDARLITPARIPFGDTASLFVYGWNPSTLRDSAVRDTQVILAGVGQAGSSDNVGPRIRVLPCDSSWSGGQPFGRTAEIPVPFCLNIFFDDSSGISSSDGPDEGVVLSVPGTLDPWHPAELGEGKDFTQAWTRLSLDASTFVPGRTYPLQIFARDLMGNASSSTLELRTRAAGEIDLYEVFNRPNPVKGSETTFHFKLLSDADSNGVVPSTVQASIRIHTISGKLVRVLRTDLAQVGQPRPRAVWDLKDSFRNEVANGLYPYTVTLRVKDQEGRNWKQVRKHGIVAVSR